MWIIYIVSFRLSVTQQHVERRMVTSVAGIIAKIDLSANVAINKFSNRLVNSKFICHFLMCVKSHHQLETLCGHWRPKTGIFSPHCWERPFCSCRCCRNDQNQCDQSLNVTEDLIIPLRTGRKTQMHILYCEDAFTSASIAKKLLVALWGVKNWDYLYSACISRCFHFIFYCTWSSGHTDLQMIVSCDLYRRSHWTCWEYTLACFQL